MREFSPYEQHVINEKFVKQDSTNIRDMLTKNFLEKVKIVIHFLDDGQIKFNYYSESVDSRIAMEELVNLVDLIEYLEKNGYIRKYPPTTLSLEDFDLNPNLSLGNFNGTAVKRSLLPFGAISVANFIKENQNFNFRATQPLLALASHNFRSFEERRHRDSIRMQRRAHLITIVVALFSMLFTAYQSNKSYNSVNLNVGYLKGRLISDSLNYKSIQRENIKLFTQLDSIKSILRTKKAKSKKKLR